MGQRRRLHFDGHAFISRQILRRDGLIAERIAPATVLLRLDARPEALSITVGGLRGGPLPLPPVLTGGGIETAEGDGIRYDVTARLPVVGLLIRYHGALHPT